MKIYLRWLGGVAQSATPPKIRALNARSPFTLSRKKIEANCIHKPPRPVGCIKRGFFRRTMFEKAEFT